MKIVKVFSTTDQDREDDHIASIEGAVMDAISSVLSANSVKKETDFDSSFVFSFPVDPTITSDSVTLLVEVLVEKELILLTQPLEHAIHTYVERAILKWREEVRVVVRMQVQGFGDTVYSPNA